MAYMYVTDHVSLVENSFVRKYNMYTIQSILVTCIGMARVKLPPAIPVPLVALPCPGERNYPDAETRLM